MEGRREGLGRRSWGRGGGTAIADDRELTGVVQTSAMVHGFQNREHRGDAGKKANSPRNKIRPRGGPRGVLTMAAGGELTGAMQSSATKLHSPIRGYGEDAEGMANSTMSHVRPGKARGAPAESPSLVLVINDTKLLMPCVKCFELGISNTCDEDVRGKE
jgi:hypothetical protein